MTDAKEVENTLKDVNLSDEEYEKFEDELKEFRELENMKIFLEVENDRLKRQAENLTSELEGINVTMSSTEDYLASYEKRKKEHSHNIEKAAAKRDLLADEVSSLHLQIKAVREDIATSLKLEENFEGELHDINSEKVVVLKRLNDITTGLQKISREKEHKVPHLKWYDGTLKQIYNVFMEAQNRMEVSLIMRKK